MTTDTDTTLELEPAEASKPTPAPKRPGGWLETLLTVGLLALVGVLSVARLTMRGVESQAFADAAILGQSWITPLLLAFLFAVAVDLAIYTAIAVIRHDPRSLSAWTLLVVFSGLTVWFQAHGPEPWMVMATAPTALVLIMFARHLEPALQAARRDRSATAPRSSKHWPWQRRQDRPERPAVVINNHLASSAGAQAEAAALTTSPQADGEPGEPGESHTTTATPHQQPAPAEAHPTPHREEIAPPAPPLTIPEPEDITEEAEEIPTPPRTAAPRRHQTSRRTTPVEVDPTLTVEEVWEDILTRGHTAAARGERYGWRAIQTDTRLGEYRAKKAAERLATHLAEQETS